MMVWILYLFLAGSLPADPIAEWNHFEKAVRDGTLPKEEAKKQFPALYAGMKNLCSGFPSKQPASWVFPVQDHGNRDMGAGGFQPHIRYGDSPIRGYDFYDGNRHGGHPAYDIFVRHGKPAVALAPVDLFILSIESNWEPGSEIRGGRYVWALDPGRDFLFYFAHLDEILVKPGSVCKAGEIVGTVGRTGKNAYPRRSPTHLHLMVLKVQEGNLIPVDYLPYLQSGRRPRK